MTNDHETQLQVLALKARGDTYQQISEATGIKVPTLQGIITRNKDTLAIIEDKMIEHKVSKSKKILDKAHDLIERKLDRIVDSHEAQDEARAMLKRGEISPEEYRNISMTFIDATLTELNSISREAWNQSQVESGKPTSIAASPREARDDLVRLVEALKIEGNELTLERLVFGPSEPSREIIEAEENEF
jgi:hypothetical protein